MGWSDIHNDLLTEIMKRVDFNDAIRSEAVCRNWHLSQCRKYARKPSTRIWVKFTDIPLELWSIRGLSLLSSGVGRPLFLDKVTEKMERHGYGRVFVEADPARPYPKCIYVDYKDGEEPFPVDVTYEKRPPHCMKCRVFGHDCEGNVERTRPCLKIFVGNLKWGVDDARLCEVFGEHGKVVSARVVYDRESGRSRGFGFVTMGSEDDVYEAIAALDGERLDGRFINVNIAEERPRRNF